MKRLILNNYGQDIETFNVLFDFLHKEGFETVIMVIESNYFLKNLFDIGLIKDEEKTKFEYKNVNCEIIFKTQIKDSDFSVDAIISTWLYDDQIFEIEKRIGVGVLIGIPWQENSLSLWTMTYGPFNLSLDRKETRISISNNALKETMDNLTNNRINWSLPSQEDRRTIKRILRSHKSVIEPSEIFAYLLREKNLSLRLSFDFYYWCRKLTQVKTKGIGL